MNGKIDNWGNLCIERAGQMKVMECRIGGNVPSGYYDHFEACNHNCPLFGEPDKQETTFPEGCHTTLTICHGVELTFSTFTDERRSDEVSK